MAEAQKATTASAAKDSNAKRLVQVKIVSDFFPGYRAGEIATFEAEYAKTLCSDDNPRNQAIAEWVDEVPAQTSSYRAPRMVAA